MFVQSHKAQVTFLNQSSQEKRLILSWMKFRVKYMFTTNSKSYILAMLVDQARLL